MDRVRSLPLTTMFGTRNLFARLPKVRGALALCYHGVVEKRVDPRLERNLHLVSELKEHVRLIRRRNVVGLDEFIHEVSTGNHVVSNPILVTFDDGYTNNQLAAELFAEHKIPITIFVTTSAVEGNGLIWTVELSLLLLHGNAEVIEVLGQRWPLAKREEREAVFQKVRSSLKRMPSAARRTVMDSLRSQFPTEESHRLVTLFPSLRIMNWQELAQVSGSGVSIGSHGVDHELHHAEQAESVRRHELAASRRAVQQRLGIACDSFAFPNGDHCSESPVELRGAGYRMGFTTRAAWIGPSPELMTLPRVSPGGSQARFIAQLKELGEP